MSDYKPLDSAADVLPVGLQPTPFGEVWQALQQVAASVWNVDPSVYRAGMAWLWYAVNHPDDLASDSLRALLVAALISEQAPLVKDWQTNAELVEYLRVWRTYSPTYAKLEAIFVTFGARVEVRPISDAESQGVVPVTDRRLAFYLRVEDFDAERPLTLDEVYQIAVRATPLGARPVPYFALVGSSDVFAGPASAGLVRALWAPEPASAPPMSFVVVDSATGAIVHGFNQALKVYELPSVVLNSEDGYETYELPSVSLPTPNVVIGVPMSGPVQAFWFTDEGREETNDKTFTVVGNSLFDEDGSIARNELYELAVPLSFMQYDGNMFAADSDSDTVRYLQTTERLTLSVPGDSTTRGKSAWSVQCAKLFVLSYANTQLPDVQIELPINEVGAYGTSITLPTIDGEYESGGKTWKPSAWDIGAFGSSYSLTADTVAHLVFTEVQQYQEITLYMASGTKAMQTNITSAFKEDVSSTYVYQLYEDESLTIPWTGYDYSNDYEMGYYSSLSGDWVTYPRQSVADMPDTSASTTSEAKTGRMLLDVGRLWVFTNYTGSYAVNLSSVKVRIYPKAQQHYAAYFNYDNAYTNNSFTSTTKVVYFSPTGGASARFFGHYIADNGTLVDVLDSGGSSVKKAGDGLNASSVAGNSSLRLEQSSSVSRRARVMTFTLSHPTFIGWLHVNHTDQSVTSGTVKRLLDDDGNAIAYNANLKYTAVCIFSVSNSLVNEATFNGQYCIGSDDTYPGELCFKQIHGSITANRIWVAMETVNNYIWAYFTSSGSVIGTNTPQTNATVYPLYDENGAPILYDATKQYETLEVQYISDGSYLMRGNVKYSSYEGGADGQLQCTATATNSIGAKRIKVWIKPL